MWSEQEDVPSLCSPGPEASKASSPSYPWGVVRLADSDVRSVFELVWDAAGYTGLEPFPREFLERLAGLIPADAIIGYHEVEVRRPWRVVDAVEIPPGGVSIEIQQAATPFCPQDPLQNGRHRNERRVLKLNCSVVIYHGLPVEWARQGFHDLNVFGVQPNAATTARFR